MTIDEQSPTPDLWDLPDSSWERFLVTMRRAFTRRCPYCGSSGVYEGYLGLRERCPACGVRFEREEGYYLGAYALNLVFHPPGRYTEPRLRGPLIDRGENYPD